MTVTFLLFQRISVALNLVLLCDNVYSWHSRQIVVQHFCFIFVFSCQIIQFLVTAHIVNGARFMKLSGVRPFVCLSACLSIRPTMQPPHATAAGFLLWGPVWAGDID